MFPNLTFSLVKIQVEIEVIIECTELSILHLSYFDHNFPYKASMKLILVSLKS